MKWYWIVLIIIVFGFGIYYLMAIKPYQDRVSSCYARGGSWLGKECEMPNIPVE